MHRGSTVTPRCKFVFECLSQVMAYSLFSACLVLHVGPMPRSQIKMLPLEVAVAEKVVCSGGSYHHIFHLSGKEV